MGYTKRKLEKLLTKKQNTTRTEELKRTKNLKLSNISKRTIPFVGIVLSFIIVLLKNVLSVDYLSVFIFIRSKILSILVHGTKAHTH